MRVFALSLLTVMLSPRPSSAQLGLVGTSVEVARFFVRGVDASYDPRTDAFLVVGAQNTVVGVCVGRDGQPKAPAFTIKPASAGFGSFPRVRYSPDINSGDGGFLVVWPEEANNTIQLHSRIVTCPGAVLGAEQIVSGGATAWLESGAALAYSSTSRRFLAVWKSFPPNAAIKARAIDINGTGIGDVVTLSAGFGRDPGVAWNPTADEFGVSFSGETATTGFSAFVRVPASNPAAFARSSFNVIPGGMTTITDVEFNTATNQYLMTWFEFPGPFTRVAAFDAAGNLLSQQLTSARLGSYDALSLGFNPISGTFLVAGVDRVNDAVLAAELDGGGNRLTQGTEPTVSTTVPPARYTRVSASTTSPMWNVNWSGRGFNAITNQAVQTSSQSTPGAPAPAPGPAPAPAPAPAPTPPPTPVPTPMMFVDTPTANSAVANDGFQIAGWAIDAGAVSGTGIDVVQAWAHPVAGGAPIFLGTATYGIARPDVGAALGAKFTNTGFSLLATFDGPGTYDVVIYGHSTVTNTFNNVQMVRVVVRAPVSNPRMWVDLPSQNDTLSMNVRVAGWALDLASSTGAGVGAIHVWAYPVAGGAPVLVGVADYGLTRPDVAAAFGPARFAACGFNLQATLPRGDYDLVVFAYSTVARAFNNVGVVRIRVV